MPGIVFLLSPSHGPIPRSDWSAATSYSNLTPAPTWLAGARYVTGSRQALWKALEGTQTQFANRRFGEFAPIASALSGMLSFSTTGDDRRLIGIRTMTAYRWPPNSPSYSRFWLTRHCAKFAAVRQTTSRRLDLLSEPPRRLLHQGLLVVVGAEAGISTDAAELPPLASPLGRRPVGPGAVSSVDQHGMSDGPQAAAFAVGHS